MSELKIPISYESYPTTDILISHHPAKSPTATPIMIVALNRPRKQNAVTAAMMLDLENAFTLFDLDDRVKVIVLTGAGKTFCAGADLEIGFQGGQERSIDHRDGGGRISLAIYRCRKPTICAMAGSAVGVGMTMTLPAAIRIGHSTSKYGFVFARRGVTMEACSSFFLPRLIGHSRAMYLLTTGATYPPDSRHFGPLFQETCERREDVLPRAVGLAREVAENCSALAVGLNQALMWRGPGTAEEAHVLDSGVLYHMFSSRDQKEGVGAFFEKRKPDFKGTFEEDAPPNYPWWTETDPVHRKTGKLESKL